MYKLWPAIIAFCVSTVGPIAVRLFKYLGLSFVIYQGTVTIMDATLQHLTDSIGGIPGDLGAFVVMLGFTKGVSIYVASFSASAWYKFVFRPVAKLVPVNGYGGLS